MIKKHELPLIITFLFIGIVGLGLTLLLPDLGLMDLVISIGFGISQILGLIVILRNSTLTRTKFWRVIQFFIGIILIGAIFKIQYYPGAKLISSVGLIGIAITYLIRYTKKQNKETLDMLKLAWVLVAYIGSALMFLHWVPDYVSILGIVIFWIMFYNFYLDLKRKANDIIE